MENRRRHFRQSLSSAHYLKVTLTSNSESMSIVGTMVNLSIGGIRIETADANISTHERWIATFMLDAESMAIAVERVYALPEVRASYGFRFLPPINLNFREAQEKTIWKFLLEQQRSERRQKQETGRLAS